jgi:hypothetical protein
MSANLNLGYGYPQGYMKRPQGVREERTGVTQLKKTTQMKLICVEFYSWGYRMRIQVLFGGRQKGTILIWEYTNTKRLITPGLWFKSV